MLNKLYTLKHTFFIIIKVRSFFENKIVCFSTTLKTNYIGVMSFVDIWYIFIFVLFAKHAYPHGNHALNFVK